MEEVKAEKLVTATKKGSAVLDQWLPDHIKNHYHVLETVPILPCFWNLVLNQCAGCYTRERNIV